MLSGRRFVPGTRRGKVIVKGRKLTSDRRRTPEMCGVIVNSPVGNPTVGERPRLWSQCLSS